MCSYLAVILREVDLCVEKNLSLYLNRLKVAISKTYAKRLELGL